YGRAPGRRRPRGRARWVHGTSEGARVRGGAPVTAGTAVGGGVPAVRVLDRLGLSRWWSPWSAAAAAVALILAIPMLVVAVGAGGAGGRGGWAERAWGGGAGYRRGSVVLVGGAGGLALVIGVVAAWLVATCDFPGRRVLGWALVLPLSVPAYIAAYT